MLFLAVLVLALSALGAYAAGFDVLLPLLVDLPGWKAEPADGADATAEGVRAVMAFRSYESGDRTLEVNIMVGMQAGMSWMPDYKEGYKMETNEGVMEVKKINGFLVSYMFERENNSGGIIVLLQDGSADPNKGAVLVLGFEGVGLDEMLKTAQRFNWAKMKEQVARLK
jgi:hypothetical protein